MTEASPLRECSRCRTARPYAEFNRRGKNNDRLDSWCRHCRRATHDVWAAANPHLIKQKDAATRQRRRETVIEHYGGICACCGESELAFLAIDHIDGGGNKHRKTLGDAGLGTSFYRWLVKQDFPAGFRVLCHNCNQALGHYGYCPHQRPIGPAPRRTVEMIRQQSLGLTGLRCDAPRQEALL